MKVLPIPNADGYLVSEDGLVFSDKNGRRAQIRPFRNSRGGYLRITLCVDGCPTKEYIHRLVALTFIGPAPSIAHEIRHLDGDPLNNHVSNLTWGTHAENMQDMVRHGRQGPVCHPEKLARGDRHGSKIHPERVPRGERSGAAKITETDVRLLLHHYDKTRNISEAARRVGVPRGAAKCVIQGKTWKHISRSGAGTTEPPQGDTNE